MPDFNPQKLTDTLAGAPSLDALATRRVEFAHAPRVWSDVLKPELARREIERKAAIRQAIARTIIGASLPIFVATLLAISTLVLVDFMFPTLIFIVFVCAAIVSATAWVKVFTMKSQTKQLVLTAACEPFGFTYDTLHPDFSGVEDLKSLAARAGEISNAYAGKTSSTHKIPFGVISVGSMEGVPAPTPAYDVLKTAKLLPGHSRRKFEDLIAGERAGTQFALVEAKLEASTYEDILRTLLGSNAYILFTLHKILSQVTEGQPQMLLVCAHD